MHIQSDKLNHGQGEPFMKLGVAERQKKILQREHVEPEFGIAQRKGFRNAVFSDMHHITPLSTRLPFFSVAASANERSSNKVQKVSS